MDLTTRSRIKSGVYLRYILLGAVELLVLILVLKVIHRWVVIPDWLFLSLIAGWVAKDVVLFPFTWRAYDHDGPHAPESMVGERGVAKGTLNPSGYVQVRGELWKAERAGDGPPIEAGDHVRIHHREGLVLYVTEDQG
jgi:membrane protein implicated in regulation of membrane protease activity